MDHTADENFYFVSLYKMPGSVLYSINHMVMLLDAKELGHPFPAAKVGKEGYTTCTFDDVPFRGKSVFNLVNTLGWIFSIIHPLLSLWFPSSLPSPHRKDFYQKGSEGPKFLYSHHPLHIRVVMSDLHSLSHLATWMSRA